MLIIDRVVLLINLVEKIIHSFHLQAKENMFYSYDDDDDDEFGSRSHHSWRVFCNEYLNVCFI